MKIAIGCDEAANSMKDVILAELKSQGHEVIDYGTHNGAPVLYPDIGVAVAEAIARGDAEREKPRRDYHMSIDRAAQAHDTYSAERASRSNDAHIVSIGARVVGIELAKSIVHAFLTSTFDGGRSQPKIDALRMHEKRLTAH